MIRELKRSRFLVLIFWEFPKDDVTDPGLSEYRGANKHDIRYDMIIS